MAAFQSPFLSPPQPHFQKNLSFPLTTTFSLLTPTTPSPSTSTFHTLSTHLANSDFRQADTETRRLVIALAGDAAQERGYVFFSEVQFISASDFLAIDSLWRSHTDGRCGYSVQKRIWEKKSKRDFTQFFIRVGWMRKLDTEVQQWNYRSFPDEFVWEAGKFPEGHLPLTNALRGTRLLQSILMHPAFEEGGVEESDGEEVVVVKEAAKAKVGGSRKSLETDYSF